MINMWDLKNLMGIGFQMGQIILSHSVRYGVYGSHNVLDGVLLVSYFQHWQKKKKQHFAPYLHLAVFLVPSSWSSVI